MHFNRAITLGIKDGEYSLLVKAYNNMFDGYCTFDVLDSLRTLLTDESKYIALAIGEIQNGIFKKVNEYGFLSII